MADDLKGMKVAILATDGVERIELEQPRGALYGAGASSDLISIHSGEIQARQSDLISAGTFPVDHLVTDVSVEEYDALLLPGGTVNPDGLRIDPDAVGFVKAFVATGKPVAAICHGPWTLIEADVVRGHRFTSWPSLWTDLRLAGAEPVDEVARKYIGQHISNKKSRSQVAKYIIRNQFTQVPVGTQVIEGQAMHIVQHRSKESHAHHCPAHLRWPVEPR